MTTKITAQAAFIAEHATIAGLLAGLQAAYQNHLNVSPDEINWGDVQLATDLRVVLAAALARINRTGEYAA